MHYNARGILKRRTTSVSLIYARLEFAANANRVRDCPTIVSNGRTFLCVMPRIAGQHTKEISSIYGGKASKL